MGSPRMKAVRAGRSALRAARAQLQEAMASLEMTGLQAPVPIEFPEEPAWTHAFPGGKIRGVERDIEGLTLTLGAASKDVEVRPHVHDRTEHFYVLRGHMTIVFGDGTRVDLKTGDSYLIEGGQVHSVEYSEDTIHLIVLAPPI
jgi:mannose-6-phosphate isomerase-like protein (cupin superfamily)